MIDLAAAAIFAREATAEQFRADPGHAGRPGTPRTATPARPPRARRSAWRRVASLVTPRSTEETWPSTKSPTSAC